MTMSDQCVMASLSMLTRLDFMAHAMEPMETLELVNGTITSVRRKVTIIIT